MYWLFINLILINSLTIIPLLITTYYKEIKETNKKITKKIMPFTSLLFPTFKLTK